MTIMNVRKSLLLMVLIFLECTQHVECFWSVSKIVRNVKLKRRGTSHRSSDTIQARATVAKFTPQSPSFGASLERALETKEDLPTSRVRYGARYPEDTTLTSKLEKKGWRANLSQVSNIASILCVADCTLLPLVTLVLPLLGFAASSSQGCHLNDFGHSMALWFVIPVGSFAAISNFLSHRRLKLTLPAIAGLVLVYLTNGHALLPHDLVHVFHSGLTHRLVNLMGCALTLGSNYLSKKAAPCYDPNCDC